MVIIKVMGGLGNQMFQYALFEVLKTKFSGIKLDLGAFSPNFPNRLSPVNEKNRLYNSNYHLHGYYLDKVFGINAAVASPLDLRPFDGGFFRQQIRNRPDILNTLMRLGYRDSITPEERMSSEGIQNLSAFNDNSYYSGYWQFFSLYESIHDRLVESFAFINPLDSRNAKLADEISSCNSVSLHVRRGDYLKFPGVYPLLDADYYRRAAEYIPRDRGEPRFYCFSDDIDWCRANLSFEKITFVTWNLADDNYKDMQLMSLCKHNIISNSSFSAWAAWLNANEIKTVVCPDRFIHGAHLGMNAFFPKSWIQIPII